MSKVLISAIGTADPVRGMRDGGLMHIMRHYRPDTVYLFLTAEMVKEDLADDRIQQTFDFIRNKWDGYAPKVFRYPTDFDDPSNRRPLIEDPSDLDALMEPMDELFRIAIAEDPEAEVLINLSSGTPQMQIILAQKAMDPRHPALGIQVKTPTGKSRNPLNFSLQALEENKDELDDGSAGETLVIGNRCHEPKMKAMRREAVRYQLEALISQRNYAAIAQMRADLPRKITKLADHLKYRSQFQLKLAKEEAKGLDGMELCVERGNLSETAYELVEYFTMLKHLIHLKEYTEFLLRLNPFLVELQLELLRQQLKSRKLKVTDLFYGNRHRWKISPKKIGEKLPEMVTYLDRRLNSPLREGDISIKLLNYMLEFFSLEEPFMTLLKDCEKANFELRNQAAHDLFSVTNEEIKTTCGRSGEEIIQGLEKLLVSAVSGHNDRDLHKRLTVYERCDEIIKTCI